MSQRKTEILFKIYNEIQSQIRFCDTKTGFLLASTGILFGLLFDMYKHLSTEGLTNNQQVVITFSLICNIAALIIYIISVFPRQGEDHDTIFYWDKICSYKNNEYYTKVSEQEEEGVQKDLSNQICVLADICQTKMNHFKFGTFLLTLAIISAGIMYFLLYA